MSEDIAKDIITSNSANKELLKSDSFEKALLEGAECKKEIMTTFKQRNKACFERFSEVMLEAAPEVKALLEKKRKSRTDDDNERITAFRAEVRQMYNQAQELVAEEKAEEGKKLKAEKAVEKLIPVIMLLRAIKCRKLDDALAKVGFQIVGPTLSDKYPGLASNEKLSVLVDIFADAKSVKDKVNDSNREIEERIFTVNVPSDLQYDKDTNSSGLKSGDFKKLVDAKAKLIMAATDDAKEKAVEKIEHAATEKQFEAARAELVRDSLTAMQ